MDVGLWKQPLKRDSLTFTHEREIEFLAGPVVELYSRVKCPVAYLLAERLAVQCHHIVTMAQAGLLYSTALRAVAVDPLHS